MRKKTASEVPTRKPFTDENGNIVFNVRALGGKVFILPDPKWTADKLGTIILPETVKSRKQVGTVLSCGPGVKNTRTKKFEYGVPAGTRVYFEDTVPWSYDAIDPIDGKEYRLVMCSIVDICAIEE